MKPKVWYGFFLTFRGKLVLGISLLGILLNLYDVFNENILIKNFVTDRELTKLSAVAQLLVDDVINDFLVGNQPDLLEMLYLASSQKDVEFICVSDTKNIVRYSTNAALINTVYPPSPNDDILKNHLRYFVRSFPLQKNNLPFMGTLHIGYSLRSAKADIRHALFRTIREDTLLLLCSILLAWFISGFLVNPLTEMKNSAEKIAKGDFTARVAYDSPDRIGELAQSFNSMAFQLGDLTQNLENKIKDKTHQLEESNKKLLELDKLKSNFVSMVSHELRTPLTSIIGFSRTLLNLKLSEEKRAECLNIIEAEGKRLARMVEELLDITKIEAGNFSLNISSFSMVGLFQECTAILKDRIACPIEFKFPPDLPEINGDKDRIRQVAINLLENAAKYSPAGSTIFVGGKNAGNEIIISVTDRGKGIDENDKEKIFEKFYRGRDEITATTRGSGLGLFIARQILAAHNGSIWVESESGKGSTFFFKIPKSILETTAHA